MKTLVVQCSCNALLTTFVVSYSGDYKVKFLSLCASCTRTISFETSIEMLIERCSALPTPPPEPTPEILLEEDAAFLKALKIEPGLMPSQGDSIGQ